MNADSNRRSSSARPASRPPGFVILLAGYFAAEEPVVRLELATQRAFGSVFLMTMIAGMALYGVPYILPQFLSTFADYDAFQSGLTTFVTGLQLQRRAAGTADDSDVADARRQLEQAQTGNPLLDANVQVYSDQLAAYLGQEPGTLDTLLADFEPPPVPPDQTAVGDPPSLIRRRPDIRSAERMLASKNASIGASIAQYFPQVQPLGLISFSAPGTGGLLRQRNMTWFVGPTLSWNFLDIPATTAKVEQARANFDEAEASYRSTVLNALRDAEEWPVAIRRAAQRRAVVCRRGASVGPEGRRRPPPPRTRRGEPDRRAHRPPAGAAGRAGAGPEHRPADVVVGVPAEQARARLGRARRTRCVRPLEMTS